MVFFVSLKNPTAHCEDLILYIVFDFETYKVDIGGSFEFIKLFTRGSYNH